MRPGTGRTRAKEWDRVPEEPQWVPYLAKLLQELASGGESWRPTYHFSLIGTGNHGEACSSDALGEWRSTGSLFSGFE